MLLSDTAGCLVHKQPWRVAQVTVTWGNGRLRFFEMFVLTLDMAYFTSGQTDRVGRTRPYKGVRSM